MKQCFKILAYMVSIIVLVMITGCSTVTDDQQTKEIADSLTIPEVDNIGGYEIKTDAIHYTIVVNGQYKYVNYETYTNSQKIEFYASPTEMVILNTVNGVTQYYTKTYEDSKQTYTNPVQHVFDDLQELKFNYTESVNNDGMDYLVYEAVQTVQSIQQEQIQYDLYSIDMEWIDGKRYSFRYYSYSDGSTLISAEAPDEINPLLTEDTKWVVDLDSQYLYHTVTKEKVSFAIKDKSTGKGVSPIGSNSTVIESQYSIYAYVNQATGWIEKLSYAQSESDVSILYAAEIVKPVITDEMTELDDQTVEMIKMLINMLESII